MAVKIQKQIEIVVDGDDVETLKGICQLARLHFDQHLRKVCDTRTVSGYDGRQTAAIENLMQEIFDA